MIGDKWTMLIIRDMIIEGKRHFREFLQSKEKIATNILTNRLQKLVEEGVIYTQQDPDHKQKIIYSLTEKGIDLFPILMEQAKWSMKYQPVDPEDAKKAKAILDGGPELIQIIMDDLRSIHTKNWEK